jgi:hypothetical protein
MAERSVVRCRKDRRDGAEEGEVSRLTNGSVGRYLQIVTVP